MVGVPSHNLYGKLIPSTDNVSFLGLVFDRRFTLAIHIRWLKESCKKPLAILKKLLCNFQDRQGHFTQFLLQWFSQNSIMDAIYMGQSPIHYYMNCSCLKYGTYTRNWEFYSSNADSFHTE